MIVKIIDRKFDTKEYNRKALNPIQSWEWGESKKNLGIEVIRIGTFENEILHEVFQMTLHPIPYTGYKIGYLPRSTWPHEEVIKFLYDYGKKHDLIFIKLEPYVEKKSYEIPLHGKLNTKYQIQKSPHPLFPEWTQLLDISKSEEELLKNMKPKTRYNIRLAEKKGVQVREMTNDEGFELFAKLYFETTKRQKYFGHNYHYHKTVWEALKHSQAHILIAFYDKKPLAAYELLKFHDRFYYPYGGTSTEHRNLMASNLLMWEAIKLGKKYHTTTFDMWGSLPPEYDDASSWAGFTKFKEGYGTKYQKLIGSYDLIINPALYKIYNFAYIIRRLLLKLKR